MKPIYENANPEGYHSVTPAITVRGAMAASDFYQRAFDATIHRCMEMKDKIMHAEMTLGDSRVMFSDEFPEYGILSPQSIGGSASTLMLYVSDADAVFERAVAAGAKVVMPLSNQFWGDRTGRLQDPFGHFWSVSTRVEQVSEEEVDRRGREWMQQSRSAS